METLKEFFGGNYRPAFLSAERNQGTQHYGTFLGIVPYTSASTGKTISVVKFLDKDNKESLIATFTLRVEKDGYTGEDACNKPLRITSVKNETGTWLWHIDFIKV